MSYTTINKSTDYFNTLTWTGDGSASRNITGVGFQPDWVWGKCRNAAVSHALYDAVRGASNLLNSNTTSAEGTNAALSAFISDGFTVNSDSYLNGNSNTYVGWNWLAGGTASSNTDGSITSTVSANTTSGFSIVSWTGNGSNATIGHGLGSAPKMIIIRRRPNISDWVVYHDAVGNTSRLVLNSTGASSANSTFFNNTSPTSSVFSVGTDGGSNASGDAMIAYCFAEKKGYSKFGSYTGNGNADGTFVYTGFKPAFILQKRTNSASTGWGIIDNTRSPNNEMRNMLLANSTAVEDTSGAPAVDFLSNGFKWRTADGWFNGGGDPHIYMAFGQSLVGSNNVPCTAR
jgi:hypothetical protein